MEQDLQLESNSSTYTFGQKFLSLFILVACSTITGILFGLLGGFTFPKFWKFKQYRIKPKIKVIVLPPLVFMIIMGSISRNFFGSVMDAYPTTWTYWVRSICLSILLVRGGLQVAFKDQGLMILLISVVPSFIEANVIAIIAYNTFAMPLTVCYTMAYVISCISPSVVVPALISLLDRGYGKKNGLVSSLIAAGTFDDIICIICFGICKTISYSTFGMESESLGFAILILFAQNIAGLIAGVSMGMLGQFLKHIKNKRRRIYCKLTYCIFCAVTFVVIGEITGFTDSKYIASLSFGYTCFRHWGQDKPHKEIYWLWFIIQPLFFGSVGATLVFSLINQEDLSYGGLCIVVGVIIRVIVIYLISYSQKFLNNKERLFMGIAWIAKATVQAALAGTVLKDGQSQNNPQFIEYGETIQTVAIFSIIICAPIGSILLNSFGPRLLNCDQNESYATNNKSMQSMKIQRIILEDEIKSYSQQMDPHITQERQSISINRISKQNLLSKIYQENDPQSNLTSN